MRVMVKTANWKYESCFIAILGVLVFLLKIKLLTSVASNWINSHWHFFVLF